MSSPVDHQYNNSGDVVVENQPTLPCGQIIDAKNTLQSFVTPVDAMEAGLTPTVYAVAITEVPVTPVIIVSEAQDAPLYANTSNPTSSHVSPTASQPYKSRTTVWILVAIVAVAAATGLGVFFAFNGQEDSSSSTPMGPVLAPTSPPVAETINPAPTVTTKQTISDVFLTFINEIKLSSEDIALGGTTPESMALEWMIDHANATWDLSNLDASLENAMTFRIIQRFSLLVMWFQQPENRPWARTAGWLEDDNECQWYGLSCRRIDVGGMIGTQDVITGISFVGLSGYVGTLPVDIGLLSHLEHFEIVKTYENDQQDISRNLQGTLPESIGLWTALTYFDVCQNDLTGSLPNAIGRWSLLNHFVVCFNDLWGSLPESIGEWTALTQFYVSVNSLTGSIPESTTQWTELNLFSAGYNRLTGSYPEAIGEWTALTHFDIRANDGRGTLPETIGQWTLLTYFDVSYNFGLRGTIPESIGQWTAMTYFDVSVNVLSGSIPLSIGNWSLIKTANFYSNLLTGGVPNNICNYIVREEGDVLQADCNSTGFTCTCCTTCY